MWRAGVRVPARRASTSSLALLDLAARTRAWDELIAPFYLTEPSATLRSKIADPAALAGPNAIVAAQDSAGLVHDLHTPLAALARDTALRWIHLDSSHGRQILWHSSAHILGAALERYALERGAAIALDDGPALGEAAGPSGGGGFFYDFHRLAGAHASLVRPESYAELERIARRDFLTRPVPFERAVVPAELARALFSYSPAKQAILARLGPHASISLYRTGEFVDLCRGPHLLSTKPIAALAVTSAGGLAAPGAERVYGISFGSREAHATWKQWRAEADKRDHRRLGSELELWLMHDLAPGMAMLLPHGVRIVNALTGLVREQYARRGFAEVSTPLVFKKALFDQSGHWDNYAEDMYEVRPIVSAAGAAAAHDGCSHAASDKPQDDRMGLKPMNCPGHCLIFDAKPRSYRDLPLRLADFSPLHRNEASGALTGLTRLRRFAQDDAHIFCTEDQIGEEIAASLDFLRSVYGVFGFAFTLRLSTRPAKFIGEPGLWQRAEAALQAALESARMPYELNVGDGAFYGPKIDVAVTDAGNRAHQCGTIQLDFNLPRRFNLSYVGRDGARHTPVMVHRAILGSVERFMAVLLEHTAGKLPLWCSPRQVVVCPVSDSFGSYAKHVANELAQRGLFVDRNDGESIGVQIKRASKLQYNYALVVGSEEAASGSVAVRLRGGKQISAVPLAEFAERAAAELALRQQTSSWA